MCYGRRDFFWVFFSKTATSKRLNTRSRAYERYTLYTRAMTGAKKPVENMRGTVRARIRPGVRRGCDAGARSIRNEGGDHDRQSGRRGRQLRRVIAVGNRFISIYLFDFFFFFLDPRGPTRAVSTYERTRTCPDTRVHVSFYCR